MKRFISPSTILLILVLASCKKNDLQTSSIAPAMLDETRSSRGNSNNSWCDCSQATSRSISPDGTQLQDLFKKYYKENTRELNKIDVAFRNTAAPGANDFTTLDVVYKQRKVIFLVQASNDTFAILNFDHAGRLVSADAGLPLYGGFTYKTGFRFNYQQGKLHTIEMSVLEYQGDDEYITHWYPYINIKYDQIKKNVSELYFYAYFSEIKPVIRYTYDYSKKVQHQVYPDDMLGDFHYFFFFLKYLNIFPELTPEHLLVKSQTMGVEYPGDYLRLYSDHNIDQQGKLLSYKQKSIITDNGGSFQGLVENWKIGWECFGPSNNHVMP